MSQHAQRGAWRVCVAPNSRTPNSRTPNPRTPNPATPNPATPSRGGDDRHQ
jgi:hypothetical protein